MAAPILAGLANREVLDSGRFARHAAAELKAERLAAARADGSRRRHTPPASAEPVDTSAARRRPLKSSGRLKRDAAEVALGRRNQARRDNR